MSLLPWKVLESKYVLNNKWIKVRCDKCEVPGNPPQIIQEYYVYENVDTVSVVPITKDKKVILIEQYRHGIKQNTICFPGGRMEAHETDATMAGIRELVEETGFVADEIKPLAVLPKIPGVVQGKNHMFMAYGSLKKQPVNDASEQSKMHILSIAELKEALVNGTINCAGCTAAGFLALEKLKF